MRTLRAFALPLLLAAAAVVSTAYATVPAVSRAVDAVMAGQGPPILLRADQEVYRQDPAVIVRWTDTNSQTVVRTDVRRRGIRADSTLGGSARDTLWTIRCQTTGRPDSVNATLRARGRCTDEDVTYGRTYRYQARDSISGAAVTGWSDSVSITVTAHRRAS